MLKSYFEDYLPEINYFIQLILFLLVYSLPDTDKNSLLVLGLGYLIFVEYFFISHQIIYHYFIALKFSVYSLIFLLIFSFKINLKIDNDTFNILFMFILFQISSTFILTRFFKKLDNKYIFSWGDWWFFTKKNLKYLVYYLLFIIFIELTISTALNHSFLNSTYSIIFFSIMLLYIITYIILLFLGKQAESTPFCSTSEKFGEKNLFQKLQYLILPFSIFFTIIGLFYFKSSIFSNFYLGMSFSVLILTSIVYELIYKAQKNLRVFIALKLYSIPLIFLSILIIFLWSTNHTFHSNSAENIILYTFSTITNLAILNVASLLVLLQLNYTKFKSSYLIQQIVTSPVVIFSILFPIALSFLDFFVLDLPESPFFSMLFLLLSFLSTIGLFYKLKDVLNPVNSLELVLSRIDGEVLRNYKMDIINHSEFPLDTASKILKSSFHENESLNSHTLFFIFACWMKKNRDNINGYKGLTSFKNPSYENREHHFFKDIINSIVVNKNKLMW